MQAVHQEARVAIAGRRHHRHFRWQRRPRSRHGLVDFENSQEARRQTILRPVSVPVHEGERPEHAELERDREPGGGARHQSGAQEVRRVFAGKRRPVHRGCHPQSHWVHPLRGRLAGRDDDESDLGEVRQHLRSEVQGCDVHPRRARAERQPEASLFLDVFFGRRLRQHGPAAVFGLECDVGRHREAPPCSGEARDGAAVGRLGRCRHGGQPRRR
mmetsp:Transcript_103923/g.318338  ORF Transcript_103923/g.318338 Transcript_103923/m.318338 type:complete len:215 (+) Transcript_103923:976-1620(+)